MAISITRKKFINLGWSFEYFMLHSLGYNFCSVYVMAPNSSIILVNDNVSLTLEIA